MYKDIYSFITKLFSQVFFEAKEDLFNKINEENLASYWFYEANSNSLKKGLDYLKLSKNENFDDIEVDFTRLFLCDDYFVKAPPYASYYYSIHADTKSENSVIVENFYSNSKFSPAFVLLPSDSVANELAFLSYCFEHNKTKELKVFLEDEVLSYIFYFLDNIKIHAKTNFYKGFAFLLEDFLNILKEELKLKAKKRILYNKITGEGNKS